MDNTNQNLNKKIKIEELPLNNEFTSGGNNNEFTSGGNNDNVNSSLPYIAVLGPDGLYEYTIHNMGTNEEFVTVNVIRNN